MPRTAQVDLCRTWNYADLLPLVGAARLWWWASRGRDPFRARHSHSRPGTPAVSARPAWQCFAGGQLRSRARPTRQPVGCGAFAAPRRERGRLAEPVEPAGRRGRIESGETPEEAARRELLEGTGLTTGEPTFALAISLRRRGTGDVSEPCRPRWPVRAERAGQERIPVGASRTEGGVSAEVPGEEPQCAIYLECRDRPVLAEVGVQRLLG